MESSSRPSVTLTFLVTDIEQSTRRWEEQPEAMRQALARHDAVLREAVEDHGGRLFKHTGDGVLAAFPVARSALDAAVDAQRSRCAWAFAPAKPKRAPMTTTVLP
jgi:class 3 adenylate cyclase